MLTVMNTFAPNLLTVMNTFAPNVLILMNTFALLCTDAFFLALMLNSFKFRAR